MIDFSTIAYRAGRQACADGKTTAANPYPPAPDIPEHEEWLAGWRDELATLPEALRRVREAKEQAA